jgi:hypothetical protein
VERHDQSLTHNESVMNEMSALDIIREQANRTMVEKGAIGAAGGNLNTQENEDTGGDGMLFETPPTDG